MAGPRIPTLDEIAGLQAGARESLLVAIRNSGNGEATLLDLEFAASVRADARRERGQPPLSPGCLTPAEFELGVQLALARAAYDGAAYRALSWEFRRLHTAFDKALDGARSSGNWRKRFRRLEPWVSQWEGATDAGARELFRRTLVDQAIRASLSSFHGQKLYGKARATPALRAYDEYLFNLMCAADEDDLAWLKAQVAEAGWFDAGKFGKAADQAAWLIVQHADRDPAYQAWVAHLLEAKLPTHDTDPRNFAFLVDRVALRAGRPQTYATQMECVGGRSLAPRIEDPERLEIRRAAMGLGPFPVQLEQRRNLCRRTTRQ
jgi:hypothetical protein